MHPDLLYQIALTLIPSIGPVQVKQLLEHFEPADIFRASRSTLEKIDGMGSLKADQICAFRDYARAEKEIRFIEQFRIRPLFIKEPAYPRRLLNCYDAPILLFYKGEADLNQARIIAVIGTRSNTVYGKMVTEKLIADLKEQQVLVVSGLAFGIDAIAHKAALKNALPTVGVLAHGLDQVYPSAHQSLAREIVGNGGGLLTEFSSRTRPERFNFPLRNRIVAGLSDAVIVAETDVRGGSMITAELANGYNRDVFVFPGRTNDPKSTGCNRLVRQNKGILLQDGKGLLEMMNWDDHAPEKLTQPELFQQLEPDEQQLFDILKDGSALPIDEIYRRTGIGTGRVASAILGLELKNLLLSLPGKLYRLSGA
ncbi:MAG: DNA-processing protein DprA [Chitinophagaceae bacterium]